MASEAMLYDDYIKLRDAKKGETIILSTGEVIEKGEPEGNIGKPGIKHHGQRPNLDNYDGTYV